MTNAQKLRVLRGKRSRVAALALPLENWHEYKGVLYRVSDYGYIMYEPPLQVVSGVSGQVLLLANQPTGGRDGHELARETIDGSLGPLYPIRGANEH
jgi:hypothetical protein